MIRPRLVVMVKEPRPGRVKTRLGREIGLIPAAWWVRHQTTRLLRRLEDPRWQLMLAVSPDPAAQRSRIWPAHLPRLPQGRGDLGARMGRLLRLPGPGPILIVGSDIPALGPRHIARALRQLGSHDAVIGPALDGGYWLIGLSGLRPPPPHLFQNVRWSTEHARSDTLATLGDLRVGFADPLADIDSAADLATLRHLGSAERDR